MQQFKYMDTDYLAGDDDKFQNTFYLLGHICIKLKQFR